MSKSLKKPQTVKSQTRKHQQSQHHQALPNTSSLFSQTFDNRLIHTFEAPTAADTGRPQPVQNDQLEKHMKDVLDQLREVHSFIQLQETYNRKIEVLEKNQFTLLDRIKYLENFYISNNSTQKQFPGSEFDLAQTNELDQNPNSSINEVIINQKEHPRIKDSILKKQVDPLYQQNFNTNPSRHEKSEKNVQNPKVIQQVFLDFNNTVSSANMQQFPLALTQSFKENQVSEIDTEKPRNSHSTNNTAQSGPRKISKGRQSHGSSSAHKLQLQSKMSKILTGGLNSVKADMKTFSFSQMDEKQKFLNTLHSYQQLQHKQQAHKNNAAHKLQSANKPKTDYQNTILNSQKQKQKRRKELTQISRSLEKPQQLFKEAKTFQQHHIESVEERKQVRRISSSSSSLSIHHLEQQKKILTSKKYSNRVQKTETDIPKERDTPKFDKTNKSNTSSYKTLHQIPQAQAKSTQNQSPKHKEESASKSKSSINMFPMSMQAQVQQHKQEQAKQKRATSKLMNKKHSVGTYDVSKTMHIQNSKKPGDQVKKGHNHTNSVSFFKDEENLETSIITNEGINMNNKERIDNPILKKLSEGTDKKSKQVNTIQGIRAETGVMKGNVFTLHDPASFKKLTKNMSEGVIDFGWYCQNSLKAQCTCQNVITHEDDVSVQMSPSVSVVQLDNSQRGSQLITQFKGDTSPYLDSQPIEITPLQNFAFGMVTQKVSICGDYCKNLQGDKQKEIIREMMREEFGEDLELYANKANSGKPTQRKYIICAKWWQNWCDYTSFELQAPALAEQDQPLSQPLGEDPKIPQDSPMYNPLKQFTFDNREGHNQQNYADLAKELQQYKAQYMLNDGKKRGQYRHPGKIINKNLIRAKEGAVLKHSLIEHHDFEAVSQEIWKYLKSWYDCDIVIERQIRYDPQSDMCLLDLYPDYLESDEEQS